MSTRPKNTSTMIDEAHIQQIAAYHLALLDAARKAAATRIGPSPAEVWDRDIGPLMRDLDQESRAYCAAYNALIGSEKLTCDSNEAGITVEWTEHPRDCARLQIDPHSRRVDMSLIDVGNTHERVPIEIRHAGDALVLLLHGEPANVDEAVAYLLDSFTAQLTQAECEAM
jgi:hypothetical protein